MLLLLLSLCVAMSGCVREQVNYDFDTYFTDNSAFVVDAAKVLPSRELLQSENVVEYMYYDCDTLILGDDISDVIRLTIAYTDEEYLSEKERLEQEIK